ncbi:MAG: DUF2608 domain-containing protein [Puniceicoccales bacterium]|nr:DUF2608 domain-containing protein [Puniceicoccales bacterium]
MLSNAGFEIVRLPPEGVADRLTKLIDEGVINEQTLVVWDIDNTLIEAGSDFTKGGALPIHPLFSSIIRRSQSKGVTHIALTNASPFYSDLIFREDTLVVGSVNPMKYPFDPLLMRKGDWNDYPEYFKGPEIFPKPTTFEELRIKGLEYIGVSFNDLKFQKIPRELFLFQWAHPSEENETKFLKEQLKQCGKIGKALADQSSKGQHITLDMHRIAPGFFPEDQNRHFIQSANDLTEFLAVPIFSSGIIFCNFINLYTQSYFGYLKGTILDFFLKIYREKTGQEFLNVVFIDDTFECVENVFKAMRQINKPCISIHIQ